MYLQNEKFKRSLHNQLMKNKIKYKKDRIK